MGSEALADVFARRLDGTLDHVALREQASALLRDHVDVDLAVWAVLDPATLMWASCVLDGMPRDADLENGVFANEYGQPDHLKLVDLAGGPTAGTLSQATAGDPRASRRFRDLLAPRGFSDELRLVLSDGGSSWGAVCLYRSTGTFPPGLTTSLTAAARPLALALRSALVRSTVLGPAAAPAAVDLPPTGLLVADRSGRLREVNDDARALLGGDRLTELPQVVQSVVARRAAGHLGGATAVATDGRWLTFHATPLGDANAEQAVDPDNPVDTAAYAQARQDGWTGLDTLHDQPGALPPVAASGARLPRSPVRRWECDSALTRFVLSLGHRVLETSHTTRTLEPHERRTTRLETGGRCQGAGCRSRPGTPLVPHHPRALPAAPAPPA